MLSKEDAMTEHRKLWNWIADTNRKLIGIPGECPVSKHDYFTYYNILVTPVSECYLCQYSILVDSDDSFSSCASCPVDWTNNEPSKRSSCCYDEDYHKKGLYDDWLVAYYSNDIKVCAEIAEIIANLPEK